MDENDRLIRDDLKSAQLRCYTTRFGEFKGDTAREFHDFLRLARNWELESEVQLRAWVDAARQAGLSWTQVAEALGIAKQSAIRRFSSPEQPKSIVDERTIRFGATLLNELRILKVEGEKGRELIGMGPLRLEFRQTPKKWEYLRVFSPLSDSHDLELIESGWENSGKYFPFYYYKRSLED